MKYYRFLPYSLAATTTWALVAGTVGYVFGEYWNEIVSVARNVGYGFVVLVVLFVTFYIRRRRRKHRAKSDD